MLLDIISRNMLEEQGTGKSHLGSPQGQWCQTGLRPSRNVPDQGTEQRGEAQWPAPGVGGALAGRLGWWLLAVEVPHRVLFLSAFPAEVECARDHTDSQDGGECNTGGGSGGAGGWAALLGGTWLEQRNGLPGSLAKAGAKHWSGNGLMPQVVPGLGLGGWRAAVAVEAKVGRGCVGSEPGQQGQYQSPGLCQERHRGGTAGRGFHVPLGPGEAMPGHRLWAGAAQVQTDTGTVE